MATDTKEEKKSDPTLPEIVLFGLIFIHSFSLPKNFPTKYPDASVIEMITIKENRYMCRFESDIEKSRYLLGSITDTDDVLPSDIIKNQAEVIIYNPNADELEVKTLL